MTVERKYTSIDAAQDSLRGPRQRTQHFKEEKAYLSTAFGEFLMERIKSLDVEKVILLIDAGTTLQPILEYFGAHAEALKKEGQNSGADWIDNIVVVTNNFSGFRQLLENLDPDEKDNLGAQTALRVVLLPGRILPAYNAIVGFENRYLGETLGSVLSPLKPYSAIQRIRQLVDEHNSSGGNEVKIISLVTGNWIRIRERPPTIPVPLARGAGHLAIKREMISAGDEVYIISPLGKIFVNHKKNEINHILREIVNSEISTTKNGVSDGGQPVSGRDSYKHSYKELDTNRLLPLFDSAEHRKNDNKIKLVTTFRHETSLLFQQSNNLFTALGGRFAEEDEVTPTRARHVNPTNFESLKFQFSVEHIEAIPHMMFEFDPVNCKKYSVQMTTVSTLKPAMRDIVLNKEWQSKDPLFRPVKDSPDTLNPVTVGLADRWQQLVADFPHKSTRKQEILEFFYVENSLAQILAGEILKIPEYRVQSLNASSTEFATTVDSLKDLALREIRDEEEIDLKELSKRETYFYDQLLQKTEKVHLIIAKFFDEPIGWGAYSWDDERQVQILMMYVRPRFRGFGVARDVLKNIESDANRFGITDFYLNAEVEREGSIQFYQRQGYGPKKQKPKMITMSKSCVGTN